MSISLTKAGQNSNWAYFVTEDDIKADTREGFSSRACSRGTLLEQCSFMCIKDFVGIIDPREQNFHPAKWSMIWNLLYIREAPGVNLIEQTWKCALVSTDTFLLRLDLDGKCKTFTSQISQFVHPSPLELLNSCMLKIQNRVRNWWAWDTASRWSEKRGTCLGCHQFMTCKRLVIVQRQQHRDCGSKAVTKKAFIPILAHKASFFCLLPRVYYDMEQAPAVCSLVCACANWPWSILPEQNPSCVSALRLLST